MHPTADTDLKINSWYLDDGTLCGSPSDLEAARKIVEEDGPTRGLHLNHSNSLLFIPPDATSTINPLPQDIPITKDGFTLLGSPIALLLSASPSCRRELLRSKTSYLGSQTLKIHRLKPPYLDHASPYQRFLFSLKTCPFSHIQQSITNFDIAQREALSILLAVPFQTGPGSKHPFHAPMVA